MKAIIRLMMANEIFLGIGKSLCFENHVQYSCFKYMLVEKKCAKKMDSEFLTLHFLSFLVYSVTFSMHVLKQIVFYSFSVFVWVVRVKFLSNAYDTLWRDANLCVLLFGILHTSSRRRHDLNLKLGSNAFLWAIGK